MDLTLNASKSSIPFVDCWIGAWAMHEPHFLSLQTQLQAMNISVHLSNADANRDAAMERIESSFSVTENGIGVISISGSLMKQSSSFSQSASTVAIRRELNRMAADPMVSGIILRIDSPGGTVAGTKELADAITKAKASKPVWAFCNDLTASAAYWVASQCDRIEANPTAQVGSIGTYCVVRDASAAADKAGFKIHVVKAGDFKGMATPGTEITDAHLAELSAHVKGLNTFFLDAVSTGRSMSMEDVSKLADGRVHLASEAEKLGLIDGVSAFEDFFDRFSSSVNPQTPGAPVSSQQGESVMSENTAKPVSIKELESSFPKSSANWRLNCCKAGMTMAECQDSYVQMLEAEAEMANKRAELAERKLARPGAKALGASSKGKARSEDKPKDEDEESAEDEDEEELAEDDSEEEQAEDEEESTKSRWNAKVDSYLSRCGNNRMKATAMAKKKHPTLHKQLVATTNAAHQSRLRRSRR